MNTYQSNHRFNRRTSKMKMKYNNHYSLLVILILLHLFITCSCFTFHNNRKTVESINSNNRKQHHRQLQKSISNFLSPKLHLQELSTNEQKDEEEKTKTTIIPKTIKEITANSSTKEKERIISSKSWDYMFSLLWDFQQREGNCNVPQKFITQDGKNLGTWLTYQRVNRRKGKLRKELEQKLEEVGIVWDRIESWESMVSLLLKFQKRERHCNVPLNYITRDGKKLGSWLNHQRFNRRKGKLRISREQKLDEIGIIWDNISTESWEGMYSLLLEFHKREGNCKIPQGYITQDGKKLGTWLMTQRNYRRKGKLNKDREQRLNNAGILWDSTEYWEYMYSLLLEVQEQEGNCNVPRDYITGDGKKLGTWLMTQRNNRRKEELRKERKQKLDEIGIVWDHRKEKKELTTG